MHAHIWDKPARTIKRDIDKTVAVLAGGLVLFGGLVAIGVSFLWDVLSRRHRGR